MSAGKSPRTASAPAESPEESGFEQSVVELEAVVDRLEHEELDLEEALSVFERGVALSKQCASKLEEAETRIDALVREGGAWLERPFEAEDGEDPEEALDGEE